MRLLLALLLCAGNLLADVVWYDDTGKVLVYYSGSDRGQPTGATAKLEWEATKYPALTQTLLTSSPSLSVSNGNVGIGTTAPVTSLQVVTTSAGNMSFPVTLNNSSTDANTGVAFAFSPSTAATAYKAAIGFARTTTFARGNLYLMVDGAADSANATVDDAKVTIEYTGNVGIGTNAPQATLDVNGSVIVRTNLTVVGNIQAPKVLIGSATNGLVVVGTNLLFVTGSTTQKVTLGSYP
jgi:hypothetical protein